MVAITKGRIKSVGCIFCQGVEKRRFVVANLRTKPVSNTLIANQINIIALKQKILSDSSLPGSKPNCSTKRISTDVYLSFALVKLLTITDKSRLRFDRSVIFCKKFSGRKRNRSANIMEEKLKNLLSISSPRNRWRTEPRATPK